MAEAALRVALCDDTAMEARLLGELLDEYAQTAGVGLAWTHFESAEALVLALEQGEAYDLCLMDIVLPGMDGLAFLRQQRSAGRPLCVAYLSNSDEYKREAAALGAIAYLEKPAKSADLRVLLDEVRREKARQAADVLALDTAAGALSVPFADIVHTCRRGDACRVFLAGGRQIDAQNGAAAEAALLRHSGFLQLDGRCLVNLRQVESVAPHRFVFKDDSQMKIPRLRYRKILAEYMAFLAAQ